MTAPAVTGDRYDQVVAPQIRVDRQTRCWIWLGPVERIPILDNNLHLSVRRLVWEHWRGSLPSRRRLMRTCAEPRCVNPAHMHHGRGARRLAAPEPPGDARLERAIQRLAAWAEHEEARGYSSFSDRKTQ